MPPARKSNPKLERAQALRDDLFGPIDGIVLRRMFSGVALFHDGKSFAFVDDDIVWLKGDAAMVERLQEMGTEPFVFERPDGKRIEMGYWRMPEEAFDDPDLAVDLARAAIAVAQAAAVAKAAKPRRVAKPPKKPEAD